MGVTQAMIEQAAQARARGQSWEAVGEAVGRSADWVRKWPRKYGTRWTQALGAAEKDILQNAAAESVNTLRKLLRDKDVKTMQASAVNLLRHQIQRSKPAPAKKAKPKAVPAAAVRLAEFVEALSDDELAQLLREVAADAANGTAAPGDARPEPDTPAIPPRPECVP